jgi:hypothetical protein
MLALLIPGTTAAPAAEARPPLKAIWGPTHMPDGSSAFHEYKRLGVDVVQFHLAWNAIAPTRPRRPTNPRDPAYRWPAHISHAIRAGRRNGIQVALLVRGSPPWANGGRSSEWVPRPRHYARFLTAASRRYRSVRRWMIWGEPNRVGAFAPLPRDRPTGPQ